MSEKFLFKLKTHAKVEAGCVLTRFNFDPDMWRCDGFVQLQDYDVHHRQGPRHRHLRGDDVQHSKESSQIWSRIHLAFCRSVSNFGVNLTNI